MACNVLVIPLRRDHSAVVTAEFQLRQINFCTASVTGGFVALSYALHKLVEDGALKEMPLRTCVAAISAGIVDDELLLDLCYEEDSAAQVDLNCVMTGEGELVELQGTGEGRAFTIDEQRRLVDLCAKGIREVQSIQKAALGG